MQLNQGDEMGAPGGSLLIGFLEDGKACHLYCPCGQEFEMRRGVAEAMHTAKRMILCPACALAASGRTAKPATQTAAANAVYQAQANARHDLKAIARQRVTEALEQGIELTEIAKRYDLTAIQVRTAIKEIFLQRDTKLAPTASDLFVEKVVENYLKDPVLRRTFYDGVRLAGRKQFLWAYLHHTLEANLK